MTEREYKLLRFFMLARSALVAGLALLLVAILGVLVFALTGDNTSETLTTLLGLGLGAIGTGLGVLSSAVSRDITEYLKDSRQMPQLDDS